jgi:hypothetical protein
LAWPSWRSRSQAVKDALPKVERTLKELFLTCLPPCK